MLVQSIKSCSFQNQRQLSSQTPPSCSAQKHKEEECRCPGYKVPERKTKIESSAAHCTWPKRGEVVL